MLKENGKCPTEGKRKRKKTFSTGKKTTKAQVKKKKD